MSEGQRYQIKDGAACLELRAASPEHAARAHATAHAAPLAVIVRAVEGQPGSFAVSVARQGAHGYLTRIIKVCPAPAESAGTP